VLASGPPWLRLADGSPWTVRYCTELDLLAVDQDPVLDWMQDARFNGPRVLTTAAVTCFLPPAAGQAALPAFFERLRARGFGAELVALADTKTQGMDRAAMRDHVRAVGALVAASGLPIHIQIANENSHATQQDDLQDLAFLLELRSLIPAWIPVSLGSNQGLEPDTVDLYPGGDILTPHLNRDRVPWWAEVARVKHLIELSLSAKHLVCNDEGMGADETDKPGRRSTVPARFLVQGFFDRAGSLASIFHLEAGVHAVLPGPVQEACADAFTAGATLVADPAATFTFVNDSTEGAITHGADWGRVFKLFGFVSRTPGTPSYLLALGVGTKGTVNLDCAPTFVDGWHVAKLALELPGAQIFEVTR
jgi:hypothetical protein